MWFTMFIARDKTFMWLSGVVWAASASQWIMQWIIEVRGYFCNCALKAELFASIAKTPSVVKCMNIFMSSPSKAYQQNCQHSWTLPKLSVDLSKYMECHGDCLTAVTIWAVMAMNSVIWGGYGCDFTNHIFSDHEKYHICGRKHNKFLTDGVWLFDPCDAQKNTIGCLQCIFIILMYPTFLTQFSFEEGMISVFESMMF